jgi:Uma2 family endonuclease
MNVVRPTRANENSALRETPELLRITAAQFSVMVEAGAFTGDQRVELRGGLLYQMDPQYVPHARAKSRLFLSLAKALQAIGSSLEVLSEGSVELGEAEVPLPDLIVWEPVQLRGPIPGDRVRLLVEVSDSTLTEDLGRKRRLYAAASVPEYWVVDVFARALHQYWAPAEGAYSRSAVVPFGGTIRSPTLAGLAVPTTALSEGQEQT